MSKINHLQKLANQIISDKNLDVKFKIEISLINNTKDSINHYLEIGFPSIDNEKGLVLLNKSLITKITKEVQSIFHFSEHQMIRFVSLEVFYLLTKQKK